MWKKLLDVATKTGLGDATTSFKKVVQKTTETTEELIRTRIMERIVRV